MTALAAYLGKLQALGHSELLLCAGQGPRSQHAGVLTALPTEQAIDDLALRQLVREVAGDATLATLGTRGMVDVVQSVGNVRMRCVCMQGELGLSVLLRVLPEAPESCEQLGVPENVSALGRARSGLIVIAGPAGSGKTTLMAALVETINQQERKLVVKIDEQLELLHVNNQASVSELRVGVHCASVAQGVRDALSMDADVIVVSQLDAPGALSAALDAALQGALVIGAVRAWGATRAVDRLLASVSIDARTRTRSALADSCVGIVAQELLPKDGGVAAQEVLVRSPALSTALRDGKPGAIAALLQDGRAAGMR